MKKRILIIDDNYYEYDKVYQILSKYKVDLFPNIKDVAIDFSKLLARYARSKKTEDLQEIETIIVNYNPDLILLDVCLDEDNRDDESGYTLKELTLDVRLADVPILFLTRHTKQNLNELNHISKDARQENEIQRLIIKEYNIELLDPADSSDNKPTPQSEKPDYWDYSKAIKSFVGWNDYRLLPWTQGIADMVIVAMFYLFLPTLALLGPVIIVYGAISHHFDPIHIAEYTFIAFLPFLIVFGLFTLYLHSLQPYIRGQKVGDDDLERSSRLTMLTKKLFVSSLISYLFTKLIELSTSASDTVGNVSRNKHGMAETDFIVQIALVAGCIALLIGYYIYLNSHNTNHRLPKEKSDLHK